MNRHYRATTLVVSVVLALAGPCGGGADKPSDEQIRAALQVQLPAALEVGELDFEPPDQPDNESDTYRTRFRGTSVLTQPLYEPVEELDGTLVLEISTPDNTSVELFGLSSSVLTSGNWVTTFDTIELTPEPQGKVLDAYPPQSVVVGTPEEDQLRDRMTNLENLTTTYVGEWTGQYECAQGPTGLDLTISAGSSPGQVEALFAFYPIDESKRSFSPGSFAMRGTVSESGIVLTAGDWIDKPDATWTTIDLSGEIQPGGRSLSGRVVNEAACSTWKVTRP